jgi:hypothetical protein
MPKKLSCSDLIVRKADYNDFVAIIEAGRIDNEEMEKFCRFQRRFAQRMANAMRAKAPDNDTVTFGELFTNDDALRIYDEAVAEHEAEENPEVKIECDGENLVVMRNGVKIAKRGEPGSPQAKQWVSIEPGFVVSGGADGDLFIELARRYAPVSSLTRDWPSCAALAVALMPQIDRQPIPGREDPCRSIAATRNRRDHGNSLRRVTLEKRSPGRDSNRPGLIHRRQPFNGARRASPHRS